MIHRICHCQKQCPLLDWLCYLQQYFKPPRNQVTSFFFSLVVRDLDHKWYLLLRYVVLTYIFIKVTKFWKMGESSLFFLPRSKIILDFLISKSKKFLYFSPRSLKILRGFSRLTAKILARNQESPNNFFTKKTKILSAETSSDPKLKCFT